MANKPDYIILQDQPGLQKFFRAQGAAIEVFNYKEHKDSRPEKRVRVYVGTVAQAFSFGWQFGLWFERQIKSN